MEPAKQSWSQWSTARAALQTPYSSSYVSLAKLNKLSRSSIWERPLKHDWMPWSILACLASRKKHRGGLSSRCCLPENLVEGWVVKYQKPTGEGLGLAVVEARGQLQPLCTWEEGERTFVVDVACQHSCHFASGYDNHNYNEGHLQLRRRKQANG